MEDDIDRLEIIQSVSDKTAVFSGAIVSIIFENRYAEVDVGSQRGVSATRPVVIGREIDFPDISDGNILSVGPKTYRVTSVRADGTGMIFLDVRESAP